MNKKVAKIPEAGLEAVRLYRDVAIQQKIVEFLVPMYEQARIDEQKDVPVILVLDKAVPPEKKARPKRFIIVVVWNIVGFILSVLFIFGREAAKRLQQAGKTTKLSQEVKGTAFYRKFFVKRGEERA